MKKFCLGLATLVIVLLSLGCTEERRKPVSEKEVLPKQQKVDVAQQVALQKAKAEELEQKKKAEELERKKKAEKEAEQQQEKKRFEERVESFRTHWESYIDLVDRVEWPNHQMRGGVPSEQEMKDNKALLAAIRADKLTDQQRYDAELDRRAQRWDEWAKDKKKGWQSWLKEARLEMARRQKEMEATPPTFVLDARPDTFCAVQLSPDGLFLAVENNGHLRLRSLSSVFDLSKKEKVKPKSEEWKKFSWPLARKSSVELKDGFQLIKNGKKLFDLPEKVSDRLSTTIRLSTDEQFLVVGEGDGRLALYRMTGGKKLWSARYGTGLMLCRWGNYDAVELRLSGDWLGAVDIAHNNGIVTVAAYGGKHNPAELGLEPHNSAGSVKVWVVKMTQK